VSTFSAFRRHNERVAGMLADYECVGELLLVGVVMARAVDLDDPPFGSELSLNGVADRIYGGGDGYPTHLAYPTLDGRCDPRPRWRIRDVIRLDARRYKPGDEYSRTVCGRPTPAKDKGRCGRSPHHEHIARFVDPASGERRYVAACNYREHKAWWQALKAENKRQLEAAPAPVPPANVGGVLDRHLPEIDWWALWRNLDPKWVPPPEGRMWSKPMLTVLVEPDPDIPEQPTARPALQVLEGGWR
jgi:hypothetical protein